MQQYNTVTRDKLEILRLRKIISNPLIQQGLSRAVLYHMSLYEKSDPEKAKKYILLKQKIRKETDKR